MKFGIDWPSGFREEDVENYGYIHAYSPEAGADKPLGSILTVLFSQYCTHTRPYETGSQVKITNVSVRMAFIQISFSH